MISTIPQFPATKHIGFDDKAALDAYFRQFPPYSQFSFASLHAYDYSDDTQVSWLHGNLVLRLQDFTTMGYFYSFLGTNEAANTSETLLARAREEGIQPELQIVPEVCVQGELEQLRLRFTVVEEESCFDYILDATKLSRIAQDGRAFGNRDVQRFMQRYSEIVVEILDLTRQNVQQPILDLFDAWTRDKRKSMDEVAVERRALVRTLANSRHLDLMTLGAFLDGRLVAFTMNEVVQDGYYIGHFGKAAPQYRGLGLFMEQETAKRMLAEGCMLMNCEEDLGSAGLRAYKRSLNPIAFLKKFTIGELGA